MNEKEKIQELAGKLKGLLENNDIETYFIWSKNNLDHFYKLNEYWSERKEEFERKHLIDICNGSYFIGSFSWHKTGLFMTFSE